MPLDARRIHESVSAVVFPVYLVGGSVRDTLMGRECEDFDFATPLDPDSVEACIRAAGRRPYLVGKKFGTVGFRLDGRVIEITSFRAESYPEGSRRPAVEYLDDLAEDLSRRDFTINAMALDAETVIDLYGGRDDIASATVRAVGNARERFGEDPLRMLRAARFASQLSFAVEPETVAAMQRLAHRILLVARERWMLELDKLLLGDGAVGALRLLADTGLLRYLLPDIALQVGFDQNSRYHDRTLFEHTLAVLGATPPDITLRWAALLHDVAKPYVRIDRPDRSTYVHHDLLGGELVMRTALYLKWSTRRREDVGRLVAEHMRPDSPLKAADDDAKSPHRPDEDGR